MHKNELAKSYLIATIAVSGILLLSVTMTGIQSSHQVFAQNQTGTTNNEQFNNAAASNNTTTSPSAATTPNELPSAQPSTGAATSTSGQNVPPLNKNIVLQGFLSSAASKDPVRVKDHVASILGPRNDGGVYSGILTYQASKPVKVIVWNVVNPDNKTAIPKQFGSQSDMVKLGKMNVVLTPLGSSAKSGSGPFTGNAIELVNSGGGKNKDFTATY
ncbi:MAG: hypothetical protein WA631_16585, partial [Nitrososphaeraceae archaeon]